MPFRDRSVGLVLFGIVLIVCGLVCALMAPLVILGEMMAPPGGAPIEPKVMVPTAGLYVFLAVALVWIGIGSILARRWARALVLVLAWPWLITGIFTVGLMAVMAPHLGDLVPAGDSPIPEGVMTGVLVLVLALMTLVSVVLPGSLILFYRSPHVQGTCEARNPRPAWTDACPLAVLGLSLWLGLGALFMVPALVAYNSVVPCFGTLVSGPAGVVVILGVMALWGYCAWATYALRPAGWWVTLISTLLMTASGLVTFLRVDLIDMYRDMGIPEDQLRDLRRSGVMPGGTTMAALSAVFSVALVAWMISVKRYFRSRPR